MRSHFCVRGLRQSPVPHVDARDYIDASATNRVAPRQPLIQDVEGLLAARHRFAVCPPSCATQTESASLLSAANKVPLLAARSSEKGRDVGLLQWLVSERGALPAQPLLEVRKRGPIHLLCRQH